MADTALSFALVARQESFTRFDAVTMLSSALPTRTYIGARSIANTTTSVSNSLSRSTALLRGNTDVAAILPTLSASSGVPIIARYVFFYPAALPLPAYDAALPYPQYPVMLTWSFPP